MRSTQAAGWYAFGVAAFGLMVMPLAASADEVHERDLFRQVVKPAFSETCFKCHGPDDATREADLRLDTFEGATRDLGGYVAIAPGQWSESEVWKRISSDDPDLVMPPPDSGLTLTEEQIEGVQTWIQQGARYERHWAFEPLVQQPAPESVFQAWTESPIDAFIAAAWPEKRLQPSPLANRATRFRRLSLDLLGLLPDPKEVREFCDDSRPDAYQRVVDRMLASPHFGERWGRHWLDQARYADTHGYTVDSPRTMWPYRDWVIQAFNADMPFDQFTIEQLAGDLLPSPTTSQSVATGFHRNTLINQEGGTDAEQFRNEAVVDRVNTTGAVWLGLTVGCSQCHNHKYDPLKQKEYYQLFAFFNSTEDVNSVNPVVRVMTEQQESQLAEYEKQLKQAQLALADYDRQATAQATESGEAESVEWLPLTPVEMKSQALAVFEPQSDGSILVSGNNGDEDQYELQLEIPPGDWTALRIETLTHESLPQNGPGRAGNGNFVLNEVTLKPANQPRIEWGVAAADHSQKDYPVTAAIDGDPATGWAINIQGGKLNVNRHAILAPKSSIQTEVAVPATLKLMFGVQPPKYNIGRFRLSLTQAPVERLGIPDPKRSRLEMEVNRLTKQRNDFSSSFPSTMVMRQTSKPRESFVLIRGDFLRHGEAVSPGTPEFLPPLEPLDREPTRLDLANWLVGSEQPLTPRVVVNRMWMRLMGRGLVETENDFGSQGTLPTHPELLDWLGVTWIRDGWSRKSLLRKVVVSGTYQQSSVVSERAIEIDPKNLWLARQSRVRVEAEVVRDLALMASGLLDHRIGGPGVYPPQPDGVYAFTQRRAAWPTSQGADRYRRGMYTFFMRSAPHPMLTTFDAPRFNTTCTRRIRSNTPLQSLTLSNDQTMIELARGFAQRVSQDSDGSLQGGLDLAFNVAFSRSPSQAEMERLVTYWHSVQQDFNRHPDAAAELLGVDEPTTPASDQAAWVALCRVLMNLDEFITKE
jgi:mono/diheme cytochrome c family protein